MPWQAVDSPPPTQVTSGGWKPVSPAASEGGWKPVAPPVLGQVGNAAKTVATGVGNVLDAQRFGLAKLLTGKDNTDDQRTAERQAVGTQGIYDAMGHIPVIGHALQGGSDVIQDTLTDPLTAETFGAGPLLRAIKIGTEGATAASRLGDVASKAGKAITDTPVGALLHDTLNWGGEVTRNLGKPVTNTIRGALNKASTTGAQTTGEYKRLSQGIIDGLSDDEKMNVRKALNGEISPTTGTANLYRYQKEVGESPMTPRGGTFYSVKGHADDVGLGGAGGAAPLGERYKGSEVYGGPNRLERSSSASRPFVMKDEDLVYDDSLADSFLHHALGEEDSENLRKELRSVQETGNTGPIDDRLKTLGIQQPEIDKLHAYGDSLIGKGQGFNSIGDMKRRLYAERLAAEYAKKAGYDAIQSPEEYFALGQNSTKAVTANLTPKEQQAVTALRGITERDYAERTKTMLAQMYNEVAPSLKPEDRAPLATAIRTGVRPTGPLGDQYDKIQFHTEQAMPYRKDYVPTAHQFEEPAEGREAKPRTAGEEFDTRNLQRENVPTTDPGQLREGFDALSTNAGKMASKRVIQESLGDLMHDDSVKKLITDAGKATGEKRTDIQKVGDAWLKVIGYPRAATVSLTPRHAANILDLAANTVPPAQFPGFMKNVTALTAKLIKATPEETADLLKDGRDLGAISQDFAEHQPFFQNVPGLKHWTAANNKLVWAVDSAAKQEYAKLIKAAHPEMSDLEAGGQASERLVDYANKSPLTKALRYVAPFGTFRGSIPGAVAGGIVRNPARAALLNRATGGTMYGGKPAKGQHGATFYGPTSDVTRGIDQPGEFLRATLGAPIQGVGTLAAEGLTGNPGASVQTIGQELKDLPGRIMRGEFSKIATPGKTSPYAKAVALRTARYLNYGNAIDLRWLVDQAAAGLPEAQAAVEQLGGSQFQTPQGSIPERLGTEALRQTTGIGLR